MNTMQVKYLLILEKNYKASSQNMYVFSVMTSLSVHVEALRKEQKDESCS